MVPQWPGLHGGRAGGEGFRQAFLNRTWRKVGALASGGEPMGGGVLLFVAGLAVAANVAMLWLTLRMARRPTWDFDNRR